VYWRSKYRVSNVFLAGDPTHRRPPTTGLGLNTAVEDTLNLSWKLAMVLKHEVGAKVLNTYETERRLIGKWVQSTFCELREGLHRSMLHCNPIGKRRSLSILEVTLLSCGQSTHLSRFSSVFPSLASLLETIRKTAKHYTCCSRYS
jgi:2-polyprenyl-6-methoxyphenol hydroxylase-like FAD-dependent oxidoreductase